jgi:L-2-hydroxyglutarate oxidase LhgO
LTSAKDCRIVPFRGDYYTLDDEGGALVNGLIYPVPDPAFPFLGVHLTKHVDGTVGAGPNAVLSLSREGYRRTAFSLRDAARTLGYGGFWRFARQHYRLGAAEVWRDISKRAFVRDVQRYLPALTERNFRFGPSGIRAQAIDRHGQLHDDFVLDGTERTLNVISAPSPAATASLAIGDHLAGLALAQLR